MKRSLTKLFFSIFLCVSCSTDQEDLFDPNAERDPPEINTNVIFADPNLIQEAKDLYSKLQTLTQDGIAFGQQEAFGGGLNSFKPGSIESDFSEVANDFPAIIGFDLEVLELQDPLSESIINFKRNVVNAHENGSIITMSWHATNPMSNLDPFDRRFRVVPEMLDNGSLRGTFLLYLERIAAIFNDLKGVNGEPIPVLFRPWHEMNGDFFYWGEGLRTTEEYKQLYKDTFRILTEDFNVHNLLYMYAPNRVSDTSEYIRNYPGDDYVDMLGIDVFDFRNENFLQSALRNLQIVENVATDKNMLFALTETGLENVTQDDWWTESLYKAIRSSSITYAMIWRNATTSHFFGPFVGHPSEENFREFVAKDIILLRSDIQ